MERTGGDDVVGIKPIQQESGWARRSHPAATEVKIEGSGVEDYRCNWSHVRASAQLTSSQCPYKLFLIIQTAIVTIY